MYLNIHYIPEIADCGIIYPCYEDINIISSYQNFFVIQKSLHLKIREDKKIFIQNDNIL